jgi:putative two-component system hydrogenase maturation factor HypX/HoxX
MRALPTQPTLGPHRDDDTGIPPGSRITEPRELGPARCIGRPVSWRIGLIYSRFAGMPQALWTALSDDGHSVVRPEDIGYDTPLSPDEMVRFAEQADPDVIFCPFLKEVVPPEVCERWTTWIPHPGIRGDAGPSSLSWAVLEGEPIWGLTMVRAERAESPEQLDSGNVGAWREFAMPSDATASEVYAQYVTPAAVACAREILARMEGDPRYVGDPPAAFGDAVRGRIRPVLSQERLAFSWEDDPERIVRHIRAATFGVRATLGGTPVNVFDAHPDHQRHASARPGALLAHRDGAVLVTAGEGQAIWIGHARARRTDGGRSLKLPAIEAAGPQLRGRPESALHPDQCSVRARTHQVIRYRRIGDVGWIDATPYNGAASTAFCRGLLAVLRYAAAQDTRAIALAGGRASWSNGIHLGVIEAADDPQAEAWANINAIDDVAEMVFGLSRGVHGTRQRTIAVLGASAGAGGAVLSACFDVVLARPAINLNYHYATMGLSGSELRSLVLPLRAGAEATKRLLIDCLPTSPVAAVRLGLVDEIGPVDPWEFHQWALRRAMELAATPLVPTRMIDTRAYRRTELDDMRRDIFEDRYGFAARRMDFLGLTG